MAVLDMDVLQHFVSGQRPLVSDVPVEVFDALCVRANQADEDRAPIVPANAVHDESVQSVFRYQCDPHHLLAIGDPP